MRFCLSPRAPRGYLCAFLAIAAGGCSTGSEAPFQTSSLNARPEASMSQEPRQSEPPPTYAGPQLSAAPSYNSSSNSQAGYRPQANADAYDNTRWRDQPSYAAQPSYQPTYQPAYQPRYSQPQAYQAQPYQPQPSYQPQGYQPQSYQPYQPQPYQPRWQPGAQAQAYAAPITTGSLGNTATRQTVVVQKSDTLYSLSRRHGVPVADLVTANRIQDGKIKVGQTLVIPPKPRW